MTSPHNAKKCIVKNCNLTSKDLKRAFFEIPNNAALRQWWFDILSDYADHKKFCLSKPLVCEFHFEHNNIVSGIFEKTKKYLKPQTVPSVFAVDYPPKVQLKKHINEEKHKMHFETASTISSSQKPTENGTSSINEHVIASTSGNSFCDEHVITIDSSSVDSPTIQSLLHDPENSMEDISVLVKKIKRRKKCSVFGCSSTSDNNELFPIPSGASKSNIRKMWLRSLGRDENITSKAIAVCTRHFHKDDFYMQINYNPNRFLHLRPNAIPRFFMGETAKCEISLKDKNKWVPKNKNKWCFVSGCQSTSIGTPDKIFVSVPEEQWLKTLWFKAAKQDLQPKSKLVLFCCQDHFNLEEDTENYKEHKLTGEPIKIKEGVLPHKFNCGSTSKKKKVVTKATESVQLHLNYSNELLQKCSSIFESSEFDVPVIEHLSKSQNKCNSVRSVGTQVQIKPLCNSIGTSVRMSSVSCE